MVKVLFLTLFTCLSALSNSALIDRVSKVKSYAEHEWFVEQIPFIDIPDASVEQIYYYRASVLKRHVRYLNTEMGYILSEFVLPVSWSKKFDSLVDAAGHQINEGKWLKNKEFVEDYVAFWAKPYNPDGVHQYSESISEAAWSAYGISGHKAFITAQQKGLVTNYNGWSTARTSSNSGFDSTLGLYYISPLWDAQEYSCSSVQTTKKFDGGIGFRPSMNSYMYGNALAIAKMAELNGDTTTASQFNTKAKDLRAAVLKHLWDNERHFFYHMQRDNNTNHALLDSREEVGFYPFRFNIPDDPKYAVIWEQIRDHQGFNTTYGPSTCEVRSQWYDGKQTAQCCWWNGNSWPYSTSLTLGGIANTLINYKQTVVTKHDYYNVLLSYVKTQHRDGKPYVGECHSPTNDKWICDGVNHSEHYLHSTFIDNILGELLGIKPRTDNNFEINPSIVPDNWNYFAIENLLYHGHEITVQWDKTGDHYKAGAGLKIFVDGKEAASKTALEHTVVEIPEPKVAARRTVENYAANPLGRDYPSATASHTSSGTKAFDTIDGRIIYDSTPRNRWDNYNSPNTEDWLAVDFGKEITMNEVRLYMFSDVATGQGSVDCPASMKVQYHAKGSTTFVDVEEQKETPAKCVPNDKTVITFKAVKAQAVRVLFTRDVEKKHFVGVTELEVWAARGQ